MKDYSKSSKARSDSVSYIETRTPVDSYSIEGQVTMNLWGGGTGRYTASSVTWEQPKDQPLTKETIFSHVTDDGFGCESIESCNIEVRRHVLITRMYKHGDGPTSFDGYDVVFDGRISRKELAA